MKRDFLDLSSLSPAELSGLLALGARLKAELKIGLEHPYLRGKTLAMVFQKPSLRTRITFETGMAQLGGHAIYLAPNDIGIGERESVKDVERNLSRWVDLIMIRTFAHEIVVEMARYASIPVINGLTDYSHPCQALADYLTMLEVKGHIAGLKIAYIGDGNNVAHSLMFAGAQLGAHVWIATPPGYEPDGNAFTWTAERCALTGASCTLTHDPQIAAYGADVVYTDVWTSMG